MEQGLLKNAPQGNEFVLRNGRVLKNLHELANALVSMDDETFSHHVTKEKNDFSSWILGVFLDEKLSRQISKIRNREGIRNRLNDALKEQAKQSTPLLPPKEEPKRIEQKQASNPNEKQPERKKLLQKIFAKRKSKDLASVKATPLEASSKSEPLQDPSSTTQLAEMQRKLDDVLKKEQEIEFKERKLLEIEEKIERKLLGGPEHHQFFTKEFVQGIVTGFLITLIVVLVYAKFVLMA
jgi:hypothetical protein